MGIAVSLKGSQKATAEASKEANKQHAVSAARKIDPREGRMYRGVFFAVVLSLEGVVSAEQVLHAAGRGVERMDPQRNVTPVPKLDCGKLVSSWEPWVQIYCNNLD